MSAREDILVALFASLNRIEGVALCERNRTNRIDDDTPNALILFDGDIDGVTDRKDAVAQGREPVFPVALTPSIYGYVEGPSETVGTQINALFDQVIGAVFRDREFRQVVLAHEGGIGFDGAEFPTPAKATSPALGVFILDLSIPFTFDPNN